MTDDNQWIKRVLIKLNERYLQGSDFEDRRWIFDWDNSIALEVNLANVHQEDNALQTLTHSGVIRSRLLPNRYRKDQLDKFNDPKFAHLPEGGRLLYSNWYDVDPAYREWGWIRTLDGFDYDKFIEQGRAFAYTPNTTIGTVARFRLIDGLVPEVSYSKKVLEFPAIKEYTLTQVVLEYASWHYGEKITLKKLREELTNNQLSKADANLKQFLKGSPFTKGALRIFATVNSQSITLHEEVVLNTAQLKDLEESSI